MLKTMKLITLVSVLLAMGACGEGFRGQTSNNSFQTEDSEYFDDQGNRRSFTEADVDRQILISYSSELQGQEAATQRVASAIRAFEVRLTSDENQNFAMQARVVVSCNEAYTIERSISRSAMQSRQAVVLGSDGPYEVEVRCTSSSCQELVAAIRKVSGSNQGTVLAGLGVGGQNEGIVLYVSRSVSYTPYFATFSNVQRFEQTNSCSVNDDGPQSIGDAFTDMAVEVGMDLLEQWIQEETSDFLDDLF